MKIRIFLRQIFNRILYPYTFQLMKQLDHLVDNLKTFARSGVIC